MTKPLYQGDNKGSRSRGTTYEVDLGWRDRAACGTATEAEQRDFSDGSVHPNNLRPLARKYCDHCPVRTECTEWASTEKHFMGVAGGMLWGFAAGKRYRFSVEHRRLVKL